MTDTIAAHTDLMAQNALVGDTPDTSPYSPLKVMESAAGFYVGTSYRIFDADGRVFLEYPGSRDSRYFATAACAATCLAGMQDGDDSERRAHP